MGVGGTFYLRIQRDRLRNHVREFRRARHHPRLRVWVPAPAEITFARAVSRRAKLFFLPYLVRAGARHQRGPPACGGTKGAAKQPTSETL